jgi:hypothetical protein
VKNNKQQKRQDGDALYTINLDSIEVESPIKASSIFKNIRAIILEENDNAVIGEINAIQVFEDYIFVLDKRKSS